MRYADIVLPATTFGNGTCPRPAGAGCRDLHEAGHRANVRCRNDIEILADLAERVGIEGYDNKSELNGSKNSRRIASTISWRSGRCGPVPRPEDAVLAKEIRDPENNTGTFGQDRNISTHLGETPDPFGLGEISAIPKWAHIETSEDYPLGLSARNPARTRSIHGSQKKLNGSAGRRWVHPDDAVTRGIQDGQPVRSRSMAPVLWSG